MGHRNGTRIDAANVNQHVVTAKPAAKPRAKRATKKKVAAEEAPVESTDTPVEEIKAPKSSPFITEPSGS